MHILVLNITSVVFLHGHHMGHGLKIKGNIKFSTQNVKCIVNIIDKKTKQYDRIDECVKNLPQERPLSGLYTMQSFFVLSICL